MSSEKAIEVRGLSKSFPIYAKPHHRFLQMLSPAGGRRWFSEFHALRDVDLDIFRGETVGIVGRNGSGKSTLLQVISGILDPSAGEVRVHGRVAALLELGAGFNPEFTGRENIFLYAAVLGLSRKEIERRFDAIVEFAEIGEFIDRPVKTYSSGMYVRLAFAVAVQVDPEVLIVDEALSVGDEAFQRKCFARIEDMRNRGVTILLVSHSATAVVDLCDRAILMDRGERLLTGDPKTVVTLYQRMVHAPADSVDAIRSEIRSMQVATGVLDGTADIEPTGGATSDYPRQGEACKARAYLDESLLHVSTIAYESRGAHIEDVRMESEEGSCVNVLVPGQRYAYVYRVRFDAPFSRVRFGMMIRTVTGAELGGTASAGFGLSRMDVSRGDVVEVRFGFTCLLARGVYFMNAGVLGEIDCAEEFLDRRIDALMFRVLDSDRVVTGFVDFDFAADARRLR